MVQTCLYWANNATTFCRRPTSQKGRQENRYRTSSELENSVLETNHVTNVTKVLNETTASDRVSRSLLFLFVRTHNYYVDSRDVVTVLLIIVNIYDLTCRFSHTHTYRGTHTKAHMYDKHTRGTATTRHKSLIGRGGRKASVGDKSLTQ